MDCREVGLNTAKRVPGDFTALPRYFPSSGAVSVLELGWNGTVLLPNTVTGGEHFLNIYYSFTIGMLNRLSGGGSCLAVNPSKR